MGGKRMKNVLTLALFFVGVVVCSVPVLHAQSTEFSFQGSMKDGAAAANGNYDFEFRLFDALTAGNQHPTVVTRTNVAVSNGIFSVELDFSSVLVGAFPGADRYLEIRVKTVGGTTYTTLTPRQKIGGEPYAQKSLNSYTATNAQQLGGVAASRYVQSDVSGNVTVSGDLTVGGSTTLPIINAQTEFQIGGTRVFSIAGGLNTFAGGICGCRKYGFDKCIFRARLPEPQIRPAAAMRFLVRCRVPRTPSAAATHFLAVQPERATRRVQIIRFSVLLPVMQIRRATTTRFSAGVRAAAIRSVTTMHFLVIRPDWSAPETAIRFSVRV